MQSNFKIQPEAGITRYYCPMHCEGDKTYDKPGTCPVCNMFLVPVESKGSQKSEVKEQHHCNCHSNDQEKQMFMAAGMGEDIKKKMI